MRLIELTGNQVAGRFLDNCVSKKNMLPQMYLFSGPRYSGKEFFAIQFFKALNCESKENGFCGVCRSCKSIDSLSSSDMLLVYSFLDVLKFESYLNDYLLKPEKIKETRIKKEIYRLMIYLTQNADKKKELDEIYRVIYEDFYKNDLNPDKAEKLKIYLNELKKIKNKIPIEYLREVLEKVYITSYELKYKLLLIKDMGDLSPEASNMMLKTIEEPPKDLIVIGTAENLSGILPTIRSRSVKVRFKPYHSVERQKIQSDYGLSLDHLLENKALSHDFESMDAKELSAHIDELKQHLHFFSFLDREKNTYLNTLKSGLLYYNLSPAHVREALRIFKKRYCKNVK